MRNRLLYATLAALALLAANGCADGSDPAQPPPPPPAPAAVATVEVEPSSVRLPLGDTLRLTATLKDAAGQVLTGRPVTWSSSNASVATVSTAGTMRGVGAGEAAITATAEGRSGSAQATILAGREAAIARARAAIVDPLAADRFVLALATQTALPPGTVISPLLPPGGDDAPEPVILQDSAYLVLVDLVPTHRYGHPVIYLLIDAATGEVQRQDASSPPVVDGEAVWVTRQERVTSVDRFEPESDEQVLPPVIPIDLPEDDEPADAVGPAWRYSHATTIRSGAPRPAPPAPVWLSARDAHDCKKVAVTVASGADADLQNDARNMGNYLAGVGFDVHAFSSGQHTLDETVAGIRKAGEGLGPCDKLLIYISSHALGVGSRDYGQGHPTNTAWSLLPAVQNSVSALAAEATAGHVNIILDSCYSEALLVHMKSGRHGTFEPKPGVTVKVFAAAAFRKTALGSGFTYWQRLKEYLGADEVGLYTSKLLEKLRAAELTGESTIEQIEAAFEAAQTELGSLDQKPPQTGTFEGPPVVPPVPPGPTPALTPGLLPLGDMRQPFYTALLLATFKSLSSPLPLLAFAGGTASGEGRLGVYDLIRQQFIMQRLLPFYLWGLVAAVNPEGFAAAAALFAYSAGGFALFTATSPFGEMPDEIRTDIRVRYAAHAGGGGPSDAIVFSSGDLGVGFVVYDPVLGRFAVSDEVLPKSQFFGDFLWAYIDAVDAPAVVLARSQNSRLYFHRRTAAAPAVVTAGLGIVNGLSCLPPLCLVFPNTMTIFVFRFDGQNQPIRAADAALDFSVTEAALMRAAAGNVAALVVGRRGSADAVAELEFAPSGALLRVVPMAIPPGCSRPNGAAYVPDGAGVAVVVTCTTSHSAFVARSEVFPPP